MSGMSVTPERSQLVSFTDWYVRAGQMALIRRDDYDKLRKPGTMNLPTTRVGFQTNSTGELYARQDLTKAKLIGYASFDDGIKALRAKKIDYFIYDCTGDLARARPAPRSISGPDRALPAADR